MAARHSLAWLVIANSVGVLLATLLLVPGLNRWLEPLTYGRWMPVHLNFQLYGWCSLPSVAWLIRVYQAGREPASRWSRGALWAWSVALGIGGISWLNGGSSGKLFLDWQGYARVLFPLASFALWLLLARGLFCGWRRAESGSGRAIAAKLIGLGFLLLVPFALYGSASPDVYPSVNPDSGGPTGTSLLESSLGIILILLLLPFGFGKAKQARRIPVLLSWSWFVVGLALSAALGHGNRSHRDAGQILAVGSLLPWVFLLPMYYHSFPGPAKIQRWRYACLAWWGLLLLSAFLVFLPGALDRFKFTDALVGHSHMAMAGFISSLNIVILASLLEPSGVFDSTWAFGLWQGGTLGYVLVMAVAGWCESIHPAFTIVPGALRNWLYLLRLICGGLMFAASVHWLTRSLRETESPLLPRSRRPSQTRGQRPDSTREDRAAGFPARGSGRPIPEELVT
jgi:cytochrome c oxidase cbb3-type subunit 1